jgi:hypothetical protein
MVRPSVEGRPGPTFTPIGAWLQDDTPTDRTIRRLAHGRDRAGGTHVDAASKAAALFTASGHRGQEIIFPVENSDFFLGIASAAFPSMVVLSTMGILVFGGYTAWAATRGALPAWIPRPPHWRRRWKPRRPLTLWRCSRLARFGQGRRQHRGLVGFGRPPWLLCMSRIHSPAEMTPKDTPSTRIAAGEERSLGQTHGSSPSRSY